MKVGDPTDPSTDIGALVDYAHMQSVLSYVERGKLEGATLCCGGRRIREDSGGYFVAPTIFTGVKNSMAIAQEEIFGPVLSIVPFDDASEAVAIANESAYGLGAAVWTSDIDQALLTAKELSAGQVWINNYDAADITVPWGGTKQSGNARDKSLHAFEQYCCLKAVWIELHDRAARAT